MTNKFFHDLRFKIIFLKEKTYETFKMFFISYLVPIIHLLYVNLLKRTEYYSQVKLNTESPHEKWVEFLYNSLNYVFIAAHAAFAVYLYQEFKRRSSKESTWYNPKAVFLTAIIIIFLIAYLITLVEQTPGLILYKIDLYEKFSNMAFILVIVCSFFIPTEAKLNTSVRGNLKSSTTYNHKKVKI